VAGSATVAACASGDAIAIVAGNATVDGSAVAGASPIETGKTIVGGIAIVAGNATVDGSAVAGASPIETGKTIVGGIAVVTGSATVTGSASVAGTREVPGRAPLANRRAEGALASVKLTCETCSGKLYIIAVATCSSLFVRPSLEAGKIEGRRIPLFAMSLVAVKKRDKVNVFDPRWQASVSTGALLHGTLVFKK
jgi:hypothetical protein